MQDFQRFVVAASRQIVRQLRINRSREQSFQLENFCRNRSQSFEMLFGLTPAIFVRDNRSSFAQSDGQIGFG